MDDWDYGDEKLPTDGGEDADCCKMFSCFWVRIKRSETNKFQRMSLHIAPLPNFLLLSFVIKLIRRNYLINFSLMVLFAMVW